MVKMLALALLLQVIMAVLGQSPCTRENRYIDPNLCLNGLRQKALDNTAFQFHRTPTELAITEVPFKDRLYTQRSLVEQTFGVPSLDLSMVDRFVSMLHTSPSDSYTGCDHTEIIPNEKKFDVDPLSDMSYTSWDVQKPPHTHWDFEDGDFFTLIKLDPSTSKTLEVVTNIANNNFNGATTLVPYTTPMNPTRVVRPYPTILYKQTRRVAPERIPVYLFNVTAFAQRNGLQGPVGLSWFQTVYDASSAVSAENQNCATLVADGSRGLLPFNNFMLSVFLSVRFTSPAFTYTCGPYTIRHPAADFYMDSVPSKGRAYNDPADYRTGSNITYSMELSRYAPSPNDLGGRIFTLVAMDRQSQFINNLIVNIQGSDFSTGTIMMPYVGPIVEGENDFSPQFFLYQQDGQVDCSLSRYIRQQPCQMPNRCFRDVEEFVADHGLQWVGLARTHVGPTTYSRCLGDPTLYVP